MEDYHENENTGSIISICVNRPHLCLPVKVTAGLIAPIGTMSHGPFEKIKIRWHSSKRGSYS